MARNNAAGKIERKVSAVFKRLVHDTLGGRPRSNEKEDAISVCLLKTLPTIGHLYRIDDGTPLFSRNLDRKLYELPAHTYASLLIQNGESLAYIRDQLGHHSIKRTVDTYGHFVPGTNRAAVDRLDDTTGRNLYATNSSGRGRTG